jgi:acetylglutamate kinase
MRVVIKYGGNAMVEDQTRAAAIKAIAGLKQSGHEIVLVHGGGPFIQQALDAAGFESRFIDGLRQTPPEQLPHVEMALKGKVNGALVTLLYNQGIRAVGLSGKDGQMVRAVQERSESGDLGRVGRVEKVNPELAELLLANDFMPVVTCIAAGDDGLDYNVNADMLAGHVAGAVSADLYLVLTDVDGLMEDPDIPESVISRLTLAELDALLPSISGGMIPKLKSCRVALKDGVGTAIITNGMKPELIRKAIEGDEHAGTHIVRV